MLLTEIKRLSASEYRGGKDELPGPLHKDSLKNTKALPGHKDIVYNVKRGNGGAVITLYDKSKTNAEVVGQMHLLQEKNIPVSDTSNTYSVGSITTDEDYRGKGFGLAMYGIALSLEKMTLIAGESQTPSGRKMWQKLYIIPGVEVFGVIEVESTEDDDSALDAVMQMGGEVIATKRSFGYNEPSHWIRFDVEPGKGELTPAVKTKLNKLYTDRYRRDSYLIAKWNP